MKYAVFSKKTNQLICRVVGTKENWQIIDNENLAKALEPYRNTDNIALQIAALVEGGRILLKDETVEVMEEPVATEPLSERVEPALKILKELLIRAEQKRKERAEIEAHKQNLLLEQQRAMIVMDNDGQYYVTMDGDGIGNQVAQAQFQNDEPKVKQISLKIDAGKDLFIEWAMNYGGVIIEAGGDEGNARVTAAALQHIEEFRENYFKTVGATVTMGVGKTISESIQARELGKLRGKNQVVYWDENSQKELDLRLKQKGPETTESKIIESGVLDQPPLGASPQAPKRPRYITSGDDFEANQKAQQAYEEWLQAQKRELSS